MTHAHDLRHLPRWSGWTLAVVLVGGMLLLLLSLPGLGSQPRLILFILPILISAYVGGLGPGLLATALAALLSSYFLLPPTPGFGIGQPYDLAAWVVLWISGILISVLNEWWRRSQRQLESSREAAQSTQQRLAVSLDATSRAEKRAAAESEARARAEEMAAIVEVVPAAVWIAHDPECQRITGNRMAHELLRLPWGANLSLSACPGERPSHFRVLKDGVELAAEHLPVQRAARGEELRGYGEQVVFDDGTMLHLYGNATALRDEQGRPRGAVGAFVDLTEHKMIEEALRESEERFRQLAAAIPQLVWSAREDGTVDYISARIHLYQGIRQRPDGSWEWLPTLHPDDAEGTVRAWQKAMKAGQTYQTEHRLHMADGQWRWHLSRSVPVRNGHGRIVRWFGTATDIEDNKRTEMELAAAKRRLEDALRAKDHFLAVLSHELRTPLTPVAAGVSLLQRAELPPAMRETLELMRRNVEMEVRLIDDLLDVTRIVRGKIELNKRPADLCEILHHAVEVCTPDLEARGLHFSTDLGHEQHYPVVADVARLQQVFWNLLKNAVKFTPHGGCVGIRCRREDDTVVVEVVDSGAGIEPEALGRIFNAFEQAERSVTRHFGGLGLGLTISKSLVEMHGGTIEAYSEGKGKGSTFTVRLPLVSAAGPLTASETEETEGTGSAGRPRPLRILLVEDHGDTARMMRNLLMADGHDVTIAGDAASALEEADKQPFDLLISDLGLPDMSGLDLLRELRAHHHAMPGIALSGYGQEADIRRSREAGFATHLTKPTSVQRLAEAITAVAG